MKYVFMILWVISCGAAAGAEVVVGDGRERVIAILGQPHGNMRLADMETLYYDRGTVELEAGRVTAVKLVSATQAEARQKEEADRQNEAARARSERQQAAETEKQNILASAAFPTLTPQEQLARWESFKNQYPEASLPPEYEQAVAKVAAAQTPPASPAPDIAELEDPQKKLSSSKQRKLARRIKPAQAPAEDESRSDQPPPFF